MGALETRFCLNENVCNSQSGFVQMKNQICFEKSVKSRFDRGGGQRWQGNKDDEN
jgi:hypothetical protein